MSRSKVKGQGHRDKKKMKKMRILFGSRPLGAVLMRQFFGSGPRGRRQLRRWENQLIMSSSHSELRSPAGRKPHQAGHWAVVETAEAMALQQYSVAAPPL